MDLGVQAMATTSFGGYDVCPGDFTRVISQASESRKYVNVQNKDVA